MSLITWLPLRGDLKNYGLEDRTFTTSTATVDNSGKIGKCYKFSATTGTGIYSSDKGYMSTYINNHSFSICAWIKTTIINEYTPVVFLSYGVGLLTSTISRFSLGDATKTVVATNNISTSDGKWHHLCGTYDINTNKLIMYVDGVPGTAVDYPTGTYSSNWNNGLYIGRNPNNSIANASFFFQGSMNDVRIYDHCLSPKEVKEISKGLVLHYPLNLIDGYIGGRNYVLENPTSIGTNNFSKKYSISSDLINVIRNKTITFSAEIYGSNMYYEHYGIDLCISYVDGSTNTWSGFTKSMSILNKVNIERKVYTKTITVPDKEIKSITNCNIFARGHDNTKGDSVFEVKNLKLELGSVATPWTPAPEDVNYDNIIYDCSGYGNNGTISGILTSDSDTPVGMCSTIFNGTDNAIQLGNLSTLVPEGIFTFNCWFKRKTGDYSSKGYETIFGGPPGFELEGKNDTTNENKICAHNWGGGKIEYSLDEWHMLTMVRTTSDSKFYLDGILKINGSAATIPSGNYFVGSWASATLQNYKGSLCDVKIYNTALSADNIKELYQTRFLIDNKLNMYCTEYVESDGIKFNNTGVLNASNFSENPYLMDMKIKVLDDGSYWARIFHHNNKSGTKLFASTDKFATEAIIKDEDRYSRLYLMSHFISSGKYEFLVELPDDGNGVWRWTQTNNPVTSTSAGTVNFINGSTNFTNGIMKCSGNTFMAHTSSSGNWLCAVGCWTKFLTGIPGFGGKTVNGTLDLWVRIDNITITNSSASVYNNAIAANELIEY